MNKSKTIRATYIAEFDKKSGITTWMYIPEENKENKMSETNLEHYKKELKEIFNEYYDEPSEIIREIKALMGVEIKGYGFQSCTGAILDWMAQPYKEPILDDAERKYLADVIRPFRNKIDTISKFQTWDDSSQYIYIGMKDRRWSNLPCFPKGTMYKGMKAGKHYTLEELGL